MCPQENVKQPKCNDQVGLRYFVQVGILYFFKDLLYPEHLEQLAHICQIYVYLTRDSKPILTNGSQLQGGYKVKGKLGS